MTMVKFVLWYLKVWVEDYEKVVGDGKGKDFYNWCVKTYKPESDGWDKELKLLDDVDKVDNILEDK